MFVLAACQDQQSARPPSAPPRSEVAAQRLQAQSVALISELPGRINASVTAEIRPQVGGIVRSRNFTEGSEVKQGDVLYEIEPAPLQAAYESAVAALQRAEAGVSNAQSRFDRYQILTTRSVVSQQNLDDAQATLTQGRADVAAAKASLEVARINLDRARIEAPIGGRVDASNVTIGALVTLNQAPALTIIRQLDPINVDIPQSSANLLRLRRAIAEGRVAPSGQEIPVELVLEDGSTYAWTGKLQFSGAAVAETVGTVTLRAVFPNPERMLLPGMYVRARIQEGTSPDAFLLPQRAVTRNARGEATARFVNAQNRVEERVLDAGRRVGNSWMVTKGVATGDRVVVDGFQRIRVGQDVTVREAVVDDRTGDVGTVPIDASARSARVEPASASGAEAARLRR